MAGVQVPAGLQRFQPPEQAPSGRIDTNLPDTSRALAGTSDALMGASEAIVKAVDKHENDIGDLEALKRANTFEIEYKKGLDGDSVAGTPGLRHLEGDPTAAYNDFDHRMDDRYKELSGTEDSGLSSKTRLKIQRKMSETYNNLYGTRLASYGAQHSKYDAQETESSVGLAKNRLMDASSLYDSKKPETVDNFQKGIHDIEQTRISHAIRIGAAVPSENGNAWWIDGEGKPQKVMVNTIVQQQMASDVSDGITKSILNLTATGTVASVAAAEDLKKTYEKRLEESNRIKVEEKVGEAKVEQDAYTALAQIRASPGSRQDILSKLDPKVRRKTEDFRQDEEYRGDAERTRQSNNSYNVLMNHILSHNEPNKPGYISSRTMLEGTSEFKNNFGNIRDSKQREAIYDAVDNPNHSKDEVLLKMYDYLGANQLQNFDQTTLWKEMSGLSREDKQKFEKYWADSRNETNAQRESRLNHWTQKFLERVETTGLVRRNDPSRRFFVGSELVYRNEVAGLFRQRAGSFPNNATDEQLASFVEQMVSDEVKFKNSKKWFGSTKYQPPRALSAPFSISAATPADVKPAQVGTAATPQIQNQTAPKTSGGVVQSVSETDTRNAIVEWRKKNPGKNPTRDDIQNYMAEQNKK